LYPLAKKTCSQEKNCSQQNKLPITMQGAGVLHRNIASSQDKRTKNDFSDMYLIAQQQ